MSQNEFNVKTEAPETENTAADIFHEDQDEGIAAFADSIYSSPDEYVEDAEPDLTGKTYDSFDISCELAEIEELVDKMRSDNSKIWELAECALQYKIIRKVNIVTVAVTIASLILFAAGRWMYEMKYISHWFEVLCVLAAVPIWYPFAYERYVQLKAKTDCGVSDHEAGPEISVVGGIVCAILNTIVVVLALACIGEMSFWGIALFMDVFAWIYMIALNVWWSRRIERITYRQHPQEWAVLHTMEDAQEEE